MSQQANVKAHGGSPPENYQRYFVPAIGLPAAKRLVEEAALRAGERVLDVACGTGAVARLASAAVGTDGAVAGLDINPGMLAVARSTTPSGMGIEWHEASADALPFPEASFDAVLCQMGLQFMPDMHAALGEMRRVLAAGGRLLFNVPGPTPQLFAMLAEALGRHIGTEAATFVHQVFSLHDTEEIQHLVDGVGFQDVSVQAHALSLRLPPAEEFLWQYVLSTPLAGAVAQVNDECRRSMQHDVVTNCQKFVKERALILELRMVVAKARK